MFTWVNEACQLAEAMIIVVLPELSKYLRKSASTELDSANETQAKFANTMVARPTRQLLHSIQTRGSREVDELSHKWETLVI